MWLPIVLLASIAGCCFAVDGGSSISGVSVTCYETLETCIEACGMKCYAADHCNDSEQPMIACAPNVSHAAMHWKATTALICLYGVVKEFRPATPFLTPFLVSHYKNLSIADVYSDVYPFWTYSYMIFLIPIFLMTDLLRYKPVICLEAFALTATWSLLVWGQGLHLMQLMQILFGLSSAAEIAYFSYMYAVVEEKYFQRVTSYIRTAAMCGKLAAFALAQYLVSSHSGSYLLLNQISFGAVAIVTVIALLLPPVPKRRDSLDLVKEEQPIAEELTRAEFERQKLDGGVSAYFARTLSAFRIYRRPTVLRWSLWWAMASCGIYQVGNYAQTLWLSLQEDSDDVANGFVECINTSLGALLSFSVQYLPINWRRWGEPLLCLSSLLIAAILVLISHANHVLVAYAGYVCVNAIYVLLITAASFNIASELSAANYGLVFGCNTLVAICLQSMLTFAVADARGFNLDIRTQFTVYGVYFACVGCLFLTAFAFSAFRRHLRSNQTQDE